MQRKEKKEDKKKNRIYKDPLGDYTNFTNSEENLTQTHDEKAMLVRDDDEEDEYEDPNMGGLST